MVLNMDVPVSVLIPAKNEAQHIADCLKSVGWARDVVVVDSGSQDGTIEIASSLGASVVQFAYMKGGPKKKNWALQNVPFRYDWVLILDADERITPELASEIAATLKDGTPHRGFYVNRRNYFLDKWIRHAGYYPSWNLRLLKRGCARYEMLTDVDTQSGDNEVHEHVIVDGSTGRLNNPMDHFAYPDIGQFIEKHNRYSNWEAVLGRRIFNDLNNSAGDKSIDATLRRKRTLKRMARSFPFPHWLRFAYHYFLKRGFLDGAHGYIFCHLLAEYEFWIWAKTRLSASSAPDRLDKAVASAPPLRHFTAGSGPAERL